MRRCIVASMDEGEPIAYEVLQEGVPVHASEGERVGTVHHVVAVQELDIFHGLVISVPSTGTRFVEAADVAYLHERRVDLRIDSVATRELPEPSGSAPVYEGDAAHMGKWSHWVNRLTMHDDWRRKE